MASIIPNIHNAGEIVPRSSSVDSAIFDGGEDSPDEIFDGEEESFDELNEDNQQNGQCKLVILFFYLKISFNLLEHLYHV
jgi:hypothetical protein